MLTAPGDVALSEVLGALSYALDLTEGEPPGHAVRTTAIGMRLAEEIGLPEEQRSGLFYALLLKDAGCSSNAARLSSLFAADDHEAKRAMKAVDWSRPGALAAYTWQSIEPGRGPLAKARRMKAIAGEDEVTREMIGTRCERGAEIARMLELPEDSAAAIAALDEHWDGSGHPRGLRGEEIPLLGRVLCLAQTVEIFSRTTGPRGAYAMAIKRAGRWFDPALVSALLAFRDDAAFWGPLEDPRMVPVAAAWEPADRVVLADQARLDRVADAFARVIDAKSPYTARHSTEVARWAVAIGAQLELSPRPAARPAPRRAAARHRQARRLQPDPRQARAARPRRARGDPRAPAPHAADPRARRLLRGDRRDRGLAPRAPRRQRLPPGSARRSTSRGRRACWPSQTSGRR